MLCLIYSAQIHRSHRSKLPLWSGKITLSPMWRLWRRKLMSKWSNNSAIRCKIQALRKNLAALVDASRRLCPLKLIKWMNLMIQSVKRCGILLMRARCQSLNKTTLFIYLMSATYPIKTFGSSSSGTMRSSSQVSGARQNCVCLIGRNQTWWIRSQHSVVHSRIWVCNFCRCLIH